MAQGQLPRSFGVERGASFAELLGCRGDVERLYADAIEEVRTQWVDHNIQDPAHDIKHILTVTEHVKRALATEPRGERQSATLILSAILHEADDAKLFKTDGSTNAQRILAKVLPACSSRDRFIQDVIEIIDLVSARKNKDSRVPAGAEW